MEMKLETLKQPNDLLMLEEIIETRIDEIKLFSVNLEKIEEINLATFNALVKLYVKLKRMGKELVYINCHSPSLKLLIQKTQLKNVFCTK